MQIALELSGRGVIATVVGYTTVPTEFTYTMSFHKFTHNISMANHTCMHSAIQARYYIELVKHEWFRQQTAKFNVATIPIQDLYTHLMS